MKCPFELPVKLEDSGPGDREIISKLNQSLCRVWSKTDADYIVQAINSYEKLANALDQAVESMGSEPVQCSGEWETGVFCGLEDRGIEDRYEACRYGYDKALEKVQEWIINEIEQALKEAEKQ